MNFPLKSPHYFRSFPPGADMLMLGWDDSGHPIYALEAGTCSAVLNLAVGYSRDRDRQVNRTSKRKGE
jgi:hypothetical protein